MPAIMLRASYTISAPTLQRFNAIVPQGNRSRIIESLMQKALLEKETELECIAAAFMADPANTECIAEDFAWDVTVGDGLEGV